MCIQQFQAHLPICQARLSHPTKRNAFKGTISEVTNKGVAAVRSLLICWVQKLKLPEAKVEQLVCLGEFEVPKFRSVTKQGNFSGGFFLGQTKLSHKIHVWYIYLHLVDIYGECGVHIPYMDGMGYRYNEWLFFILEMQRNGTRLRCLCTLRIIFWAQIYVMVPCDTPIFWNMICTVTWNTNCRRVHKADIDVGKTKVFCTNLTTTVPEYELSSINQGQPKKVQLKYPPSGQVCTNSPFSAAWVPLEKGDYNM